MSKVDSSDSSAEDDVSWDDKSVISIKDIEFVYSGGPGSLLHNGDSGREGDGKVEI